MDEQKFRLYMNDSYNNLELKYQDLIDNGLFTVKSPLPHKS